MTLSESGIQAIGFWHQASGFSWPETETRSRLVALGGPKVFELLGTAIFGGALSVSEVRNAMQGLAAETKGAFPVKSAELGSFYDALQGQLDGFHGWARIAEGVAVDTGQAIASVGTFALTSTVLIAVAALFLFVYLKGKQ